MKNNTFKNGTTEKTQIILFPVLAYTNQDLKRHLKFWSKILGIKYEVKK